MNVIQPLLLSVIMGYILGIGDVSAVSAWVCLLLSVACSGVFIVCNSIGSHGIWVVGMSIRTAVSTLIYQKVNSG